MAGRCGAGAGAGSLLLNPQVGGKTDTYTLEMAQIISNLIVCLQWHTSSNKVILPNPPQTVPSTGDQVLQDMSLSVHSH